MLAVYTLWKSVYDDGRILFGGRYNSPETRECFGTEVDSLANLVKAFQTHHHIPELDHGDSIQTVSGESRWGSSTFGKSTHHPVSLADILEFEKGFEKKS
ncbi:MAG: hypothetical protein PHF67_02845 [Candidatus Nanoarchaeia archaeon]|nr:hypothetical protein [Candidatus Nanoarchaeia archaeon]